MHKALAKVLFDKSTNLWPPELAAASGWVLHEVKFPIIDCEFTKTGRTPIRIRTDWSDWNDQPPSVQLLNSDGIPLMELPQGLPNQFNGSAHPVTGRPFICMAGTKEFHTHSSHLNEPWENYQHKPNYDMGGILMQIWNAWMKGTG